MGYSNSMAVKSTRKTSKQIHQGKTRRRRLTRTTLKLIVFEGWRACRAVMKAVLAAPPLIRAIVIPALILILWFSLNWAYHTFHKPTEIFFPLEDSLNKHPVETWKEYESLFREHATAIMTPELLAALAQVEGGGNPVARTYWRWEWTWNPLEWYRPASSAVGMFQITDGTFAEATRYCIHDHKVVEDGAWHDWQSCWFNSLYTRIMPSHAIELTAALLDRRVTQTIEHRKKVTFDQKQNLAAVIHLCGAGAGQSYVTRGFRLTPGQRCGDHDVKNYLARINALKHRFAKGAGKNETIQQAP